jgi:hypothetical protein
MIKKSRGYFAHDRHTLTADRAYGKETYTPVPAPRTQPQAHTAFTVLMHDALSRRLVTLTGYSE